MTTEPHDESMFASGPARRGRVLVSHPYPDMELLLAGTAIIAQRVDILRHGDVEFLLEGPMFDEVALGENVPKYRVISHSDGRPLEWHRV